MASNLKRLEETFEYEKKVGEEYQKGFQTWVECIMVMNDVLDKADIIEKSYHHMGSLSDGGFSARHFAEDTAVFEGDFLVEVFEFPRDMVTSVEGKPGFYRVQNQSNLTDHFIGLGKVFLQHEFPEMKRRFRRAFKLMRPGFLLGVSIKEAVDSVSQLYDGYPCMLDIFSRAFDTTESSINCDMKTEFNGPAATQRILIGVNGTHQLEMSFDVVVCAKLSFWPPEAEEWPNRERKWPPRDIVEQIIDENKVYLVAKPSTEFTERSGDEWRLTFLAEKIILKGWTHPMRFTYYIFKTIFYCHFKMEIEGKSLPSYLAKTTMYWLCEELEPDMWRDDTISENLRRLLLKLKEYLSCGVAPQYFVPSINILGSVPPALLDTAKAMDISYILEDPIACIPQRFDEAKRRMDMMIEIAKEWCDHYEELTNHMLGRQKRGVHPNPAREGYTQTSAGFFETGFELLTSELFDGESSAGDLVTGLLRMGLGYSAIRNMLLQHMAMSRRSVHQPYNVRVQGAMAENNETSDDESSSVEHARQNDDTQTEGNGEKTKFGQKDAGSHENPSGTSN